MKGSWVFFQVMAHLKTSFSQQQQQQSGGAGAGGGAMTTPSRSAPVRRTVLTRTFESVRAIALCHNVTPVYEDQGDVDTASETEADQQSHQTVTYQASSPDEV